MRVVDLPFVGGAPRDGLGSSSSVTVALVKALATYCGQHCPFRVAELACEIEIDRLAQPIGKQDQYAAAFGGMTSSNSDGLLGGGDAAGTSAETCVPWSDGCCCSYTGVCRQESTFLRNRAGASPRAVPNSARVRRNEGQAYRARECCRRAGSTTSARSSTTGGSEETAAAGVTDARADAHTSSARSGCVGARLRARAAAASCSSSPRWTAAADRLGVGAGRLSPMNFVRE